MRAAIVAIGNVYRRDDGVAHRSAELIPTLPDVLTVSVVQAAPELAPDIAESDCVIFMDADVEPGEPRIEEIGSAAARSPIGHAIAPAEIVQLARILYGFKGRAFLCRIPAVNFGDGEGLSTDAECNARRAAELVVEFLKSC
jgi:hydrogenase maturation protease